MLKHALFGAFFLFSLILSVACTPFTAEPPAPVTMIAQTVMEIVTVTPTALTGWQLTDGAAATEPDPCYWSQSSREAPEAFGASVKEALTNTQITGTIQITTFGENNSCSGYHAQAANFVFTIPVANLTDGDHMAAIAGQVWDIVDAAAQQENRPAPNTGRVTIEFQQGAAQCKWEFKHEYIVENNRFINVGQWQHHCP